MDEHFNVLDQGIMQLVMAAGQQRMARRAHLGIEVATQEMMGGADVLLTFIDQNPDGARILADALQTEVPVIVEGLLAQGPATEPEPESPKVAGPSEEAEELIRKKSFSLPVKAAIRETKEMRKAGEPGGVGPFIAALLGQEGDARRILLSLSSPEGLEEASERIKSFEAPEVDFMTAMTQNMRAVLDAAWPKILADRKAQLVERTGKDKFQELREQRYAEHPEKYEQSVNLAERFAADMPAEKQYDQRSGACIQAAANEARIRRAPEVKLDHMMLALLQEGTATFDFLRDRGVDPLAWRARLDAEIPRYEEGPRWPPNARDLGTNIPDRGREFVRKKAPPEDLKIEDIPREELKEYFEYRPTGRRFTDLVWLEAMANEDKTLAYALLKEGGITEDAIKAEIRAFETGDPEWYRVRPDLAAHLKEPGGVVLGRSWSQARACEEAAQFEARSRWAAKVEFGHVLMAILVDGTDTAELIDSLGIERERLRGEIDAQLPHYPSGPYFPEIDDRGALFSMTLLTSDRTSDLKIVEGVLRLSQRTEGVGDPGEIDILKRHGVTLTAVQARLQHLGVELMDTAP